MTNGKDEATMKRFVLSVTMAFALALSLVLFGCGESQEPPKSEEPVSAPATETPAAEEPAPATKPANFVINFDEIEYVAGENGKNIIKINYEYINKGDTNIPNTVIAIKSTQGGSELTAVSLEGKTGEVDYQVRSGGSVRCFVAYELTDTSDVTVEFFNATDSSAPAVASKVVPAQ
jgi:hypothetical protein